MTPSYALIIGSNGNGIGSHKWEDSTLMALADTEIACTPEQAANPSLYCVVNGQVVESLTAAQATQSGILKSSCATAIVSGFTSSALGTAYLYPSDPVSQANQNSAASSPSGGKIWVNKGTTTAPNWQFVAHTQAQAQAVVESLVAWVNACQSQLATLQAQVIAATSVSAVQEVVWVNP